METSVHADPFLALQEFAPWLVAPPGVPGDASCSPASRLWCVGPLTNSTLLCRHSGPEHAITHAVHRLYAEMLRLSEQLPNPEEEVDPDESRLLPGSPGLVKPPPRPKRRAAAQAQTPTSHIKKRTRGGSASTRERSRSRSHQPTLQLEYMEVEVLPRLLRHASSAHFRQPVDPSLVGDSVVCDVIVLSG